MRILISPTAFSLLITPTSVYSKFKITFLPLVNQKYRSLFLFKSLRFLSLCRCLQDPQLRRINRVILISLTVDTPRSRASAKESRTLYPTVCCYQMFAKLIQCENQA